VPVVVNHQVFDSKIVSNEERNEKENLCHFVGDRIFGGSLLFVKDSPLGIIQ
jgi:hypothetical protein